MFTHDFYPQSVIHLFYSFHLTLTLGWQLLHPSSSLSIESHTYIHTYTSHMVFLIVVWNFSRSRRELGRGRAASTCTARYNDGEQLRQQRFYADHLQGGHPGKLGGQTTLISGICSRAGNSLPTCTACLGISAVMRKRPRVHGFNADVTTDKCRATPAYLRALGTVACTARCLPNLISGSLTDRMRRVKSPLHQLRCSVSCSAPE